MAGRRFNIFFVPSGYRFANPEAVAIAAAFVPPPTKARAALIDANVGALKAAGVWPLLDALYKFAAFNQQNSCVNWVAPGTFTLTPVGGFAFVQDRGYTGNGTTAYLDTGYVPSTAGRGMTLNDGHVAGRSLSDLAAATNQRVAGNTGATTGRTVILPRDVGDIASALVNDAGGVTLASTSTQGNFIANRSAAAALQLYRNGTQLGALTTASASLATASVCFLRDNANFASLQVASGSIGRSLTAPQAAAFDAADLTYMQGVGAL